MLDKKLLEAHKELIQNLCVTNNCADCVDCSVERMAQELEIVYVTPYEVCILGGYGDELWQRYQRIAGQSGYWSGLGFEEDEQRYRFERKEFHMLKKENLKYKIAVSGTINAEGTREIGFWRVNKTDILSKLIQKAGRWCEENASELFERWSEVEEYFSSGVDENRIFIFAFHQFGVDDIIAYNYHQNRWDASTHYRSVWKLETQIDGDSMQLTFSKIR